MGDRIRQSFEKLKSFWRALSPKIRRLLFFVLLALLAGGVVLAVYLSKQESRYSTVFPNMSLTESNEVVTAIQGMGVEIKRGPNNEVMVPTPVYNQVIMDLSMRGYPKTTLTYDIFNEASGLTSTDFEKQRADVFQLQNRLQDTINTIEGIASSIVTLNLQQSNVRVWETTTNTNSAGVSIRLEPGFSLNPQQVGGIKRLVASSVPNMKPVDVKVMDAATSLTLRSDEDDSAGGIYAVLDRLELEQKMASRLEAQALNILTVAFDAEQVRVSAFVELDYDKMITESKEYIPSENSTRDSGVLQRYDRQQTTNTANPADGIPGEEDNTDLPTYVDQLTDDNTAVDYAESMDFAVSYILKQIEKDAAQVKSKSIAVSIYGDIDDYTRQSLIANVSKATGIDEENVSIENYLPVPEEPVPVEEPPFQLTTIQWIIIGGSAFVLLLIIILISALVARMKRKKREKLLLEAAQAEVVQLTDQDAEFNLQQELEERKRALREGSAKTADDAIADEVREFARNNPEITASLLRAWMKEEID